MEDPNDQRSKGLLGLIVIDTEHYLVPTVFQVFHHNGNLFLNFEALPSRGYPKRESRIPLDFFFLAFVVCS